MFDASRCRGGEDDEKAVEERRRLLGMTKEERCVLFLTSALLDDIEKHLWYFNEPINVDGRFG